MPKLQATTYDNSSAEVKALVRVLNSLGTSQTLDQHTMALKPFDDDAVLDTPFIQVQGKERIRILCAITKWFLGTFSIEPRMVEVSVPEGGAKEGLLNIDGIVHWMPNRTWYIPATLLLPKDVPIFADVSLGVKTHNGKISMVSGKSHNLPHVPRILRMIYGYAAGLAVTVTEPIVKNMYDLVQAGVETASNATQQVRETTARGTELVRERVDQATAVVSDLAAKGKETVADVTARTTQAVRETVA